MTILSRNFMIQYSFCAVLYLSLDLLWIYFIAKQIYINTLSPILSGEMAWVPALMFYLIYSFCLWFLAIKPSAKPNDAALRGAILGLAAYGTYSLTGQSFFAGWTWALTISDCGWGMIASASVAYLTRRFT